ncbi:UDP-glucose 4-epimerase GalE [Fulvivirga sedimenti]|uniref:UDP-glucose 4-epimerase n=1 Tax=Fulvivirga sedimenti TaxID=2879465 RepID=A0A9X1HWC7_9BACT|nr:UDP-glucose 4-epimerase GalE [Fulvivirga sedimenti]MCA6078263.1 UDP-glucose 4-epimerase GalE [Fulvivirga sedimenti]
MPNKIIVTGGAGYIGSHTCVELSKIGVEPVIIDNFSNSETYIVDRIRELSQTEIHLVQGDCTDSEFLKSVFGSYSDVAGIIHFAAFKAVGESSAFPLKYYQNNIDSTIAVLKAMESSNIPNLVFSSSCTVYGQPEVLPVTESSPIQPAESPYGRTKQICEDMLKDYRRAGNAVNIVSLRYFNPIGAHPSGLIGELPLGVPNNLVPFITQTAIGKRKQLTVFGKDYNTPDGTCIRDYIHVVDLARAHVAAIEFLSNLQEKGSYHLFNLGTGEGSSVQEVIDTFEKVSGVKLPYTYGERRPGDVEKVYADVSKAETELNWKCEYSLADSLRDAWNWEKLINEQKA